jgi:OCT family organic cation transporter-like MFS transporter 4/5
LFVSILLSLHPSLLIPLFIVGSLKGKATQLSFNTLYLMTTEFFPTDMRQTSVGICSIFARIGSMIAPFMKELTLATSLWVSFAIFAALTVATAILWLLLPETMDIQLPDNILQTRKVGAEEEILRRHSQTPRQTSRSAS